MRATDVGFRSPKQQTPAFYYPSVTFDGRSLSNTPTKQRPTFSSTKRFLQYQQQANRTGYRIGPGAYTIDNLDISKGHITGTPLYKDLHGLKDTSNNGYYFTGNHLVFDPHFVSKSKLDRSVYGDLPSVVSEKIISRPTTASGRGERIDMGFGGNQKQVPWFMRPQTPTKQSLSRKSEKFHSPLKSVQKSPYLTSVVSASRSKMKPKLLLDYFN